MILDPRLMVRAADRPNCCCYFVKTEEEGKRGACKIIGRLLHFHHRGRGSAVGERKMTTIRRKTRGALNDDDDNDTVVKVFSQISSSRCRWRETNRRMEQEEEEEGEKWP